ncbi:hypothetical protein BJ912DRAFT_978389 [Pholiota molesta]|nr:hypothetical protein BJ912DRAFT_978389 [Pholiota molesta]
MTAAIDVSESQSSVNTESAFSAEESDYEPALMTSKKKDPPAKRARRPVPSALKHAAAPVKLLEEEKTPSLLQSMPLDVIFEILGWLSLSDLREVSRASTLFHATLLSSAATAIWQRALKSARAPACPRDLNAPRWAKLWFGRSCENCGRREKNHHKVDFLLRRRTCTACKKRNLLVASKVPAAFPDCDDLVLSLIPYTDVGAYARGYRSSSRFYWRSDIAEMVRTVGAYRRRARMRIPGAQREFAAFVAQRTALVAKIYSTGKRFKSRYYADVANGCFCTHNV